MRRLRAVLYAGAIPLVTACASDTAGPRSAAMPSIEGATVVASPTSVLGALMAIRALDADSVAVRVRSLDTPSDPDVVTPAVRLTAHQADVPVLGLWPARSYSMRAIAYGAGGVAQGGWQAFATGSLPPDLPRYAADGDDPSPGFVVMAAGTYGLVIDNTGRVVWYHRFVNGPWLNFMAQPNGRYVARLVTPDPTDSESWVEVDVLGNVTRTFGCKLGLQARFHDLIAEPDGGYWALCDETRTMDLTSVGGNASARVTGTAIQHVSTTGDVLFNWSPFDHFDITDVEASERGGANVNWTHGNSLDFDDDGNLLVSFRNLNEVTKIDSRTGAVLWRLGGLRNEFSFAGGARVFAGQHSIRSHGSGEVTLLDNIGDPLESLAERWIIDAVRREARLVRSYGSVPRVRTLIGGSVQSLPGGRTLVSFGTEGRVEEYDADGKVHWRIDGTPGYVFRAQRIQSLYRPGADRIR